MKRPARLALILLAIAWLAAGCMTGSGETAGPPDTIAPATAVSTATPGDGLPTIRTANLPAEARETLALIRAGGPFPYRQDGIVFQNRERLLPLKPGGYYHEYTVRTPGASDRGARRIITGSGGELYYTDDHYESFQRIVP